MSAIATPVKIQLMLFLMDGLVSTRMLTTLLRIPKEQMTRERYGWTLV